MAQFSTLVRPILAVRIPITLPSVRHTLATDAHKIRFSTRLLHTSTLITAIKYMTKCYKIRKIQNSTLT